MLRIKVQLTLNSFGSMFSSDVLSQLGVNGVRLLVSGSEASRDPTGGRLPVCKVTFKIRN